MTNTPTLHINIQSKQKNITKKANLDEQDKMTKELLVVKLSA